MNWQLLMALLVASLSTRVWGEQPWFGVDVQSNTDKDYSVRLKVCEDSARAPHSLTHTHPQASPGDNLHVLVNEFYQQHGHQFKRSDEDFQAVLLVWPLCWSAQCVVTQLVASLEEAQGGKCDAW